MKTADYIVRILIFNVFITLLSIVTLIFLAFTDYYSVPLIILITSLIAYPVVYFGGMVVWIREN